MDVVYLACYRQFRLSGVASFAFIITSSLSSLSFQDIGPVALKSPGNGFMQYIMHIYVEFSGKE